MVRMGETGIGFGMACSGTTGNGFPESSLALPPMVAKVVIGTGNTENQAGDFKDKA
jgi:hypothetical protein